MKITVLGSGTSHGIPVVGCSCHVCKSDDPRDKRTRSSIYIEGSGGEKALIDAGPEFRVQALRAGISRLDAIFLTHAHADHIHGLDDTRPLTWNSPVPVYGNEASIAEMKERFAYIWRDTQQGGGKPKLLPIVVDGPVRTGGLCFTPVPAKHGALDILGWEIREDAKGPPSSVEGASDPAETGKSSPLKSCFLYLTDTSAVPPASLEYLRGGAAALSRTIIIGGLRKRPHETHFSFEQALETALDIGADRIYLTHICHEHSHAEIEEICRNFRENRNYNGREINEKESDKKVIHPAQDGLELIL